jgi:hypothetical protein
LYHWYGIGTTIIIVRKLIHHYLHLVGGWKQLLLWKYIGNTQLHPGKMGKNYFISEFFLNIT